MLTENLAGKTFPLESCMYRGTAQSVRGSSGSSCPILKSQILRLRLLRLRTGDRITKVCNFEQKKIPGFL